MDYEIMTDNELIEVMNSNCDGLTQYEASRRLNINGRNVLPKGKSKNIFNILFSQFKNSITIIMLITCIISFAIGEVIDAIVIAFIILVDIIMGTLQEYKAEKTVKSLSDMIKVKVKTLRDGKPILIDSEDLVVGDIILLESGDKVSVDARIIESSNLTVNESSLTGESNAINKNAHIQKEKSSITDSKNIVFAGTNILTGRCKCIVIKTGKDTEIGKIAVKVIDTKDSLSPLAIRMNKFTKQISFIIVAFAIILLLLLYRNGNDITEIFLVIVALCVSAMPEGLPLALTLALTIGADRMSKRNVIVKKLNSVEGLGSCTVIASDKTGTLTVNEQTLKKIVLPDDTFCEVTGTGYNDDGKIIGNTSSIFYDIAKYGMLNNEAGLSKELDGNWTSYGDSIDIAFLAFGKKLDIDISQFEKIGSIPYESENRYSLVFYKELGKVMCTAKGSCEVIIDLCDNMQYCNKIKKIDKEKLINQTEELAKEGYRVIAIASGEVDEFKLKDSYSKKDIPSLNFTCLCAFIDPVRKEVKKSISNCLDYGIKVAMITGDHPMTAYSIAKELNIVNDYDEVTTGIEIDKYKKYDDLEFDKFIRSKRVFTRVTPLQKLDIVESYKRQGEYIAVTGDGVNDALALKSANIGIAMGSGTDVAKDTANMIIVDDNFMSIVNAVEEGKNAYANIRKVVYMLLSCGLAEVLIFVLCLISNLDLPLVAIQLLWLNIVTDGLQDLALSFEKEPKLNKIKKSNGELFDNLLISETLLSGFSIGIITFLVYYSLIKLFNFDVNVARGYIMALMVFMQNIHVLNCRSEHLSIFENPIKNNYFIIISIVIAICLQIVVMEVDPLSMYLQTTSIPFSHLLLLFISSLPILFIMELFKKIKR